MTDKQEYDRLRYIERKDIIRDMRLRRDFGLSLIDYNKILWDQYNRCAICSVDSDHYARTLSVDHCHNTKQIRGLLCHNCNRALGMFKDDIDLLAKAIEYLKSHDQ